MRRNQHVGWGEKHERKIFIKLAQQKLTTKTGRQGELEWQ